MLPSSFNAVLSNTEMRASPRSRLGQEMYRLLISTASVLTLSVCAAHSQNAVLENGVTALDVITVTANRTPTEKSRTGSKVEQVSEEEIEEKSYETVRDYLNLLPGISYTANGGRGTSSNLYIRGLPGGYVKAQYNGIDISDTTGTQVAPHFQHFLTGGVAGIEILKGSQSTLYGSNAIAGVVDITTLGALADGVHHTIQAEGGSFGTAAGRYGFAAAKGDSRIAANVSGVRTDGISAWTGGSERDGYENVTLNVAAEHRFNETFSVFGSLLHINAKTEYDGDNANDPLSYEDAKMTGGRAGFNIDLLDGRLKNTFSVQGFRSERKDVWTGFPTTFIGDRRKFEYQGSFEASDRILLQYGADHERQTATVDSPVGEMDLTGVWTQAIVEPVDNLVLSAGFRHDEHSTFGGHTTGRGTVSYEFDQTGTRLHSSYGTGFRAPSLYQLYAPWGMGNPDLQAETSRSFDAGVEQTFLDGRLTTDLTYFWIEVDNLIDWDNSTYSYQQLPGTTRSQGIEASVQYEANNWLDLGGSYTYTDARLDSGERRRNVPRHMVVLSATAKPADKWMVSSDLKLAADTIDSAGKLKNYVLVNARVAYQVNENTELYLRGENLLNQNYEVVRGYNTPGFAAYAGVKAKF